MPMPFIPVEHMRNGEPLPGWKGRFWRSQHMSFAHYTFDAGASIHQHHHPNEEVWIVIDGELEVSIDAATQVAGPGSVAVIPSDTAHAVRALTSGIAVVANHPVRHDLR
jgi:unsaturated pyranuronate lyase